MSAIINKETCSIRLVTAPKEIDQEQARAVLVASFIGEYKKYLQPNELSENLTSWYGDENSVEQYYKKYFAEEFDDFQKEKLDFWVEAIVDDKLVGWATFQYEESDKTAVYMNLLVIHPDHQRKGIGKQLVYSLLNEHPNLTAINLLLRKKNKGGREFYKKLGFIVNESYERNENFVDMNLLEPLTWNNPQCEDKDKSKHAYGKKDKTTLFSVSIDQHATVTVSEGARKLYPDIDFAKQTVSQLP